MSESRYDWKGFWPITIWLATLPANIDALIVALRRYGVPTAVLFLLIVPGLLEAVCTYWCWRKIRHHIGGLMKVRQIRQALGLCNRIDHWVVDQLLAFYHATVDPNGKAMRKLKGGFWSLVASSALPFIPGPRGTCSVACGILEMKEGFIAIMVADAIHIAVSVGVIELVVRAWHAFWL